MCCASEGLKNAIVFCNRKREVAVLHRSLLRHGFNAVALHGDLDQPARMAALDQFRRGDAVILVASDVAARGLDIPEVSHVVNFDVPHHPDDYVHRVGRTGRAGRAGIAVTIVAPQDRKAVDAIERLTGQNIAWSGERTEAAPAERSRNSRDSRSRRREPGAAPRERAPAAAPARRSRAGRAAGRRAIETPACPTHDR